MKGLLVIIFLFITCHVATSQKLLLKDSSLVTLRSLDHNKLEQLKRNKDFQYDRYNQPQKSLWERFWGWFWWQVHLIMKAKSGRTTVWSILIVLGVAAIVFFVMKVISMKSGGVFARNSGGNLDYGTSVEDINNLSFEDAIRDAVESKNFRMATRLLYLQSLKQLSDKGYIQWQLNKTNTDYIMEVGGKPWQSLFKKLTYKFEYTWYGEVNMANSEFNDLQVQFQQFNNQLQ